MYSGVSTQITYLDEAFTIVGSQLLSDRIVKMTCRYRGDYGPPKFIVSNVEIPATVKYICNHESRGMTCLRNNGIEVHQIEHILSALNGMDVLDTDIYLEYADGGDIKESIAPPIAQLNSREFTLAILSCFLSRDSQKKKSVLHLDKAYVIVDEKENKSGSDNSCAIFAPLNTFHITTQINFQNFLGFQIYSQTITPLDYMKSICWARSFFSTPYPHKKEWNELRRMYPGLIRERENHYRSIMLDYNQSEWITPPILNTEPVRHKMLDFIGDLALLGVPIKAGIHIYKPSHYFNRECVMRLSKELELFGD